MMDRAFEHLGFSKRSYLRFAPLACATHFSRRTTVLVHDLHNIFPGTFRSRHVTPRPRENKSSLPATSVASTIRELLYELDAQVKVQLKVRLCRLLVLITPLNKILKTWHQTQ